MGRRRERGGGVADSGAAGGPFRLLGACGWNDCPGEFAAPATNTKRHASILKSLLVMPVSDLDEDPAFRVIDRLTWQVPYQEILAQSDSFRLDTDVPHPL